MVRKQQDQDVDALAPALNGLSEPRQQLFLFTLTLMDRFRGEGLDAAGDADAAAAAAALASTYDTASKGLIYEQRPDTLPARRMADGIAQMFEQLGRGRPTAFAADAAVVLRLLADRVEAVRRVSPADPRAFLGLAARFAARLGAPVPAPDAAGGGGGQEASGPGSSIIIP